MPHIARSSFGLPAPGNFVTGGGFLPRTGLLEDDLSQVGDPIFGSGSPLFGEGGLLGKPSREEQAVLDAPDEFFSGDTKKEKDAARKKALEAIRARQAKERQEDGTQDGQLFGSGEPLLAEGGLLGPQAASQPESGLLAEDPGFFEGLTRAARPGSLLNVIGRAAFGATEMERAENAAKREELTAGRRRRGAQQELTELLSSGTPLEEIPLGLLGRVAPEAVVGGILGQRFPGQGRADPADIRSLRAIGIDPTSDEGRKIILDGLRNDNASSDTLREIDLRLKTLDLEERAAMRTEAKETASQKRVGRETAIRRDIKGIRELSELNDALEGTSLQTGLPLQDLRRLGGDALDEALELAGIDRSARRRLTSQRDAFDKKATNFLISSLDRLPGSRVTDQQLTTLSRATAGIGVAPGANRVILADSLDTLLDVAEIEGISIKDLAKLREFANDLRKKAGLLADDPSESRDDPLNATERDELRQRELLERQ